VGHQGPIGFDGGERRADELSAAHEAADADDGDILADGEAVGAEAMDETDGEFIA